MKTKNARTGKTTYVCVSCKALGITAKDYWMKEEPVQGLICNECFKDLYPEAWANSSIGKKHMEEERLYRKGYSDGLLGKPYNFKTCLK